MKKYSTLLLSLLLTSCNVDSSSLKIISPTGAPALAFYNHSLNSNFETNSTPSNIVSMMNSSSNYDVVVIDTVSGIKAIEKGEVTPIKQDDSQSTYAAMLDKTMSPIDWSESARVIHNQIRGLDPWPVAQTILEGKTLKLFRSEIKAVGGSGKPGEMKILKNGLAVYCGDGKSIFINEVQYEGKKRMNAADFFRGHHVPDGTVLG